MYKTKQIQCNLRFVQFDEDQYALITSASADHAIDLTTQNEIKAAVLDELGFVHCEEAYKTLGDRNIGSVTVDEDGFELSLRL